MLGWVSTPYAFSHHGGSHGYSHYEYRPIGHYRHYGHLRKRQFSYHGRHFRYDGYYHEKRRFYGPHGFHGYYPFHGNHIW